MPRVTQSNNSNNSVTFDSLIQVEFIPLVIYNKEYRGRVIAFEESDEEITLSKYLDSDKQKQKEIIFTTNEEELTSEKELTLPFIVSKGNESSDDNDGIIMPRLSEKIKGVTITSEDEHYVSFPCRDNYRLKLCFDPELIEESIEFYVDFYAKDDKDDDWVIMGYVVQDKTGKLDNVHCGRVKILYKKPNDWDFSDEQISAIEKYAKNNYDRANNYSLGDSNRYDHCTDTHKNIALKLLDNPAGLGLLLGKKQDHTAVRDKPSDFTKAGESTTAGVRSSLIANNYAEKSKIFTVIDVEGDEVLNRDGTPGNNDKDLKKFKESIVEYMKSKCPDDGNYVFIGAYDDDFHSFTILVNKKKDKYTFKFVDQIIGVSSYEGDTIEQSKLLKDVSEYRGNYPMIIELYQLRNKK